MPITFQGQTGPAVVADGGQVPLRQDRTGAAVVVESHGRYYEASYRKRLFTANAAGTTVSAAGTAMTGLVVLNPNGNQNNLSIQKIAGYIAVTSASTTGLVLGSFVQGATAFTNTTPIVSQASFLQANPLPTAVASSSATVAIAPVALWPLLHNTAAINTVGEDPGFQMDFEGSITVPPGFGIAVFALGAATAASAFFGSVQWEEVPV